MLSLRTLLDEVGLECVASPAGEPVAVRSVHATELTDPTPWLKGGEVLLTTGLRLTDPDSQRAFVECLVSHRIAGLGFGTGFEHEEIPPALVDAARRHAFPVFEVPYAVPFIAITERAFAHLASDQYDLLRRALALQSYLEQLVLGERGLDEVVRATAEVIGATVAVVGLRGEPLACHPREERGAVARCVAEGPGGAEARRDDRLVLAVAGRDGSTPEAWLVGLREGEPLGDFERLVLSQTVTVVSLEMMRERITRETERRLAGDVLAEALTGRLDREELAARLRPFRIGDRAAVLVFALADPAAAASDLDRWLADGGERALVAVRQTLLCAVVDGERLDPVDLAGRARQVLAVHAPDLRAGASRVADASLLRRSFHEARCALEAVRHLNGDAPDVASHRDLGAFALLLAVGDDDALRAYCDAALGPLEDDDGPYGEELLRSLEAFIEHNGSWERAARALPCHRHTLRYRIRRVEQLTGRNLSRAHDRVELWLALRGRELLR